MKKSELNLMVLENFILHITHCSEEDNNDEPIIYTPNQLYKLVVDYIEEDHVDGKGGDEVITIKTIAEILKMELIGSEVFLKDDIDEANPVSVYATGDDTKENPIRIYTLDTKNNIRIFGLTHDQTLIETQCKDEILTYCLGGSYKKTDEVSLKDIFMHNEFVYEINLVD